MVIEKEDKLILLTNDDGLYTGGLLVNIAFDLGKLYFY